MDYRSAGVDLDAAREAKRRIAALARRTFNADTLSDIGGFGGLFRLDPGRFARPVLVASTDGVGTKLKVAILCGRHDTVGYDLVAHSINDILVQGAAPLFFLDYLAMGRLDPAVAESVVSGIVRACAEHGVVLLGGETAEMPGLYAEGDYDLAGTIVGIVEEDRIVDGRRLAPGDVLVGLPSSGLHTNGYSLARTIVFEQEGLGPESRVEPLGASVAEALLAPHRCYARVVAPLLERGWVKAMAHITGGGLTENLPRVLPEGVAALVRLGAWPLPPLFRYLRDKGRIADEEMLRTFNVGIGFVLAVAPERREAALALLAEAGERAVVIGEIVAGGREVRYEGAL